MATPSNSYETNIKVYTSDDVDKHHENYSFSEKVENEMTDFGPPRLPELDAQYLARHIWLSIHTNFDDRFAD